jgi:alpha-L-rhamnosidase
MPRLFLPILIFLASSFAASAKATSEFTASWIAAGDSSGPNTWTIFRRSFTLPAVPARAEARIAADTKYWLHVNGRLVVFEGGLKRGPNPTDTYFDTIDLTDHLQRGENKIEALVWFFGKDGFSHKNSGRAGFLLDLRAPNGAVLLATDDSWQASLHPAWGTAQKGKPNFRLAEPALRYDARRSLEDATFAPAKLLAPAGAAPWGKLHPRLIPQWSDSGLRDYPAIDGAPLPRVSKGETLVARLPYNAQITPWLDIDAPEGAVIDIRTDHYRAGGGDTIHAEYVARAGRQSHESLGWMNGHEVRYTIPAGVTIHGLKYRETAYNAGFTGAFTSDDPFLDRLWEKSRRTLLLTMRDTFMDCPDRERAQWWGDAVLQIGQSFYAFSPEATPLAAKAIRELCAWQKPDGALFSPIPGNWDKELSQQMLASVGRCGFWNYYVQSGDRATAVAAYPHVRTYLALWHLGPDGLVEHRKGGWDWADWGEEIDVRLLDQGWYCLALEGAAHLARLAGNASEADAYFATRQRVINATNTLCWQADAQIYRSPGYTGKTDDRGHGLAVVAGIAGPDKFPGIKRLLAQTKHSSPYMEKYVLESLLLMDDADAFLSRLKDRYAGIVADENSTLPELWTTRRAKPGSSTLNHSWTGGPLTLLSQYVAGLSPIDAGWTRYQIRPQLSSLRRVESVVDSAAGRISAKLTRTDDRFTLDLDSPVGTTAELHLPVPVAGTPPTEILLNGKPIPASGSPVTLVATGPDRVHLRAAPGKHRIELLSTKAEVR